MIGSLFVLVATVSAATTAWARTPAAVIDGISFQYLPSGLGATSDFTYDYDDVDFTSRVWESSSPDGGTRADLDLVVMRGARLTDGAALHDWFISYEDRPPAGARYVPVQVHGQPGWLCRDQLFWLVRPGRAVSVLLDHNRWSTLDVVRIGWSASETT